MLTNMVNVAANPPPFGGPVELVIRGKKDGRPRGWLLRRQPKSAYDFLSDRNGEIAPTLADVIASAAPGNEFTATLVPAGSGVRIGLDRDGDGYFDTTETDFGTNPADPTSHPIRILGIARSGTTIAVTWESTPGTNYLVQWRAALAAADNWNDLGGPIFANSASTTQTDSPPSTASVRFYRVHTQP
jgi:hypothetical protein